VKWVNVYVCMYDYVLRLLLCVKGSDQMMILLEIVVQYSSHVWLGISKKTAWCVFPVMACLVCVSPGGSSVPLSSEIESVVTSDRFVPRLARRLASCWKEPPPPAADSS